MSSLKAFQVIANQLLCNGLVKSVNWAAKACLN